MSKRHKRVRGRQRGTGQPDSAKDRTFHEVARGKKVSSDPPGRDLSSEELSGLITEIEKGSDRIAGVVCSALVQNTLIGAITTCLDDRNDAHKLFDISKGPFNTFYAQITAGKAFNLYNERVEEVLHAIRKVRNKFAHSVAPLDFTDPEITAGCEEFKRFEEASELREGMTDPRRRYEGACYHFTEHLLRKGTENLDLQSKELQRKVEAAMPKAPEDIAKHFSKLSDFLNLVPAGVGEDSK